MTNTTEAARSAIQRSIADAVDAAHWAALDAAQAATAKQQEANRRAMTAATQAVQDEIAALRRLQWPPRHFASISEAAHDDRQPDLREVAHLWWPELA